MEFQLNKIDFGSVIYDKSSVSLILSNIVAVAIVMSEHWTLGALMLVYWCQSVIIGFFNFLRMLMLKDFTTDGLKMNNMPVRPTRGTKVNAAFFFAFHYGFFHFIYLMFLLSGHKVLGNIDPKFILLTTAIFFVNHFYSFKYNREKDRAKKQNLGAIMFFPYLRIIPMHLTILAGGILAAGTTRALYIIFFSALKTIADVSMHAVEHNSFGTT